MKIGFISFAHHHAYSYANSVQALPNAFIGGIYDPNEVRGKEAAQMYDTTYYSDLDKLLTSDIEAVIICSENVHHKAQVIKAAKAKKQILCEKPIATTMADATEMIEVCEKEEVTLQIAFPVRFCKPIVKAKHILDSGVLGEIQGIRTTNRGQNPMDWFIDKDLSGGGAVLDHTVHMIDIVRWFTNQEVCEVYAEIDTFFKETPIEDTGILNLVLSDGTIVTHDCSWSRCDNFPTWGDITIELFGTKGHLKVDALEDHLSTYQDQGKACNEIFFGENMDLGLIKDFVDCVQANRAPFITGNDGLKAMEVGLAAYDSDRLKERIYLK